jgi:hypothetical protein
MKNALIFLFLILGVNTVSAQIGWQWAVGSKPSNSLSSSGAGFIYWRSTVDKWGDVFMGGSGGGDTLVAGTLKIYGQYTLLITKTDTNGNFLWAFKSNPRDGFLYGMTTDGAGNLYVIAGHQDTICIFGPDTLRNPDGQNMYCLAKISPSGNVLWAKNIAGNLNIKDGLAADEIGNVYLAESFYKDSITLGPFTLYNADITGATNDILLAKYNTSGDVIWAKRFGNDSNDAAGAMTVDYNGNMYVALGSASSYLNLGGTLLTGVPDSLLYCFAKFDNNGNTVWAELLDPHLNFGALAADRPGGTGEMETGNVFVTGTLNANVTLGTDTLIWNGSYNMFIARFTSSGAFVWARVDEGRCPSAPNTTGGVSIGVDLCDNVWAGSKMNALSGCYMSFSGHSVSASPPDFDPVALIGYDSAGNFLNSATVGSGGSDPSYGIGVDDRGSVYSLGSYVDTTIVGGDTFNTPRYKYEILIAKFKYDVTLCHNEIYAGIEPVAIPAGNFTLFPNPASYDFTIHSDAPFPPNSSAQLYTPEGKLIDSYTLSGTDPAVYFSGALPPGLYFCRIKTGDYSEVKKLVVLH